MLRPMLKVEVVCSLLHSLVSEHKERGEDPTEALSSPALLETIAQVKNLAGNSKEMDQFQTVRNGAGTKACTISLAWIVDLIMGLRGLCRCRPTLTSCPERNFLVASASWTRPPSKNIWRFLHAHIYRYACLGTIDLPFAISLLFRFTNSCVLWYFTPIKCYKVAEQARVKGNDFFSKKDFKLAYSCYALANQVWPCISKHT